MSVAAKPPIPKVRLQNQIDIQLYIYSIKSYFGKTLIIKEKTETSGYSNKLNPYRLGK